MNALVPNPGITQRRVRSRRAALSLLAVTVMVAVSSTAAGQTVRPSETIYLQARVGLTHYVGDFGDFGDFSSDYGTPVGFGGEIGYQFTPMFGLGLAYLAGDYPTIVPRDDDDDVLVPGQEENTWRHTVSLMAKWTFMGQRARVAPFLQVGAHASFGQTVPATTVEGEANDDAGDNLIGFGPSAGLGVDFVLSNRVSLVAELVSHLVFPDRAIDSGEDIGGGSFDLLNFLGLGLKYSFKSAFTPVSVTGITCVDGVMVNETATFTANVDRRASTPVEYRWDFGDGTTAVGTTATHSFDRAGTYTVRFSASNEGSSDARSCQVVVNPLPIPAQILSVTGSPMSFQVCEPVTVQFSAGVQGDQPLTYRWNFGDGATGSGSSPSHTYTEPGNYQVTLSLSNEQGSTERSITIQALECEADICGEVTDLNSVYFGQNSSTLTGEGRAALADNVDVLRECPDLCVRVEGYAGPGERNPQQLSADRARAVEQYYVDSGVAASRISAMGMGRAEGTTKKEGAAQFRRADSVPIPCD